MNVGERGQLQSPQSSWGSDISTHQQKRRQAQLRLMRARRELETDYGRVVPRPGVATLDCRGATVDSFDFYFENMANRCITLWSLPSSLPVERLPPAQENVCSPAIITRRVSI